MAKGDTTVRVDFEVGGESAAKLAVNNVYKAQETAVARSATVQAQARTKESAAESLARQKSRALYSQWLQDERAKQRALEQTATLERSRRDSLIEMGKGALMATAGFAGLTAASQMLQRMDASIASIAEKRVELAKAITPLSSLGDNAGNLPALRQEIVQLAAAANLSTGEVGQFMFDLQSSTGNLSKSMRGQLKGAIVEMAEATGGDLVTAQNLLTKSYQISGKEVENLTQLSNKLLYTQDQASLRFEDLATRAPEILSAGQVVGVGFNEVMASIIGASVQSGDIAKSLTGLRNILLTMEQAHKKGIVLTGDYVEKLGQLKEMFATNPQGMQDLFGSENLAVASDLVAKIDVVKSALKSLEEMGGTDSKAAKIIEQRLQDPIARMARISELNATLRREAPNLAEAGAENSMAAQWARRKGLAALGAQVQSGAPEDSWTAWAGGWRGALLGDTGLQAAGRRAEITNTAPGPLRDVLLEENFNTEKSEAIKRLVSPGGMGGMPPIISSGAAAQLESTRASSFNAASEGARIPYADPSALIASTDRNTAALQDLTKNISGSKQVAKPGGGTTNASE